MRLRSWFNRMNRRIPEPMPDEIVVTWNDGSGKPSQVFSTAGWEIRYDDEGNQVATTGPVPSSELKKSFSKRNRSPVKG